MSLLDTGRTNGHDPYVYLKDVIQRLEAWCLKNEGQLQTEAIAGPIRRALEMLRVEV